MYRSFFVKLLSLMLTVVFPVASIAADTRAMLLPQGAVSVNGTMLARSTVLVSGDRITTTDNSTGTISGPGNSINLASKSSAVYGGQSIEVTNGGAFVVTSSGTAGKVGNLTITPADDKAKYEFGERADKVMIAAVEGKLRINDGQQQMVLDAGKAIEIAADAGPDKDKNKQGSQGGAAVGATHFGLNNARAVVIAAVAAGLGAGAAFGLVQAFTAATASPTH
jgi:hypothetical protein